MAALALQAFAVGLVPLVLVKVLAPGYFAREDTRTPFRIGLISVGTNVVLNLALFRVMGHVGLALATSAAACVNAYLLWRGLDRIGRFRIGRLSVQTVLRCAAAVAAMAAVLLWTTPEDARWLEASVLGRTFWLLRSVAAGGLVYLAAIWLLGGRVAHLKHLA
jgi:putative peptidoglycan lipid II flippase